MEADLAAGGAGAGLGSGARGTVEEGAGVFGVLAGTAAAVGDNDEVGAGGIGVGEDGTGVNRPGVAVGTGGIAIAPGVAVAGT